MVGVARGVATPAADPARWHDVECGGYAADLDLWRRLADEAGPAAAVLDVGCGTGRVALDLAAAGHDVTGLDCDPGLVEELAVRARARGVRVRAEVADARTFDLGSRRFGLAIAPMQVVQLLGGSAGRRAALACVARHLEPGGRFAVALADPFGDDAPADALPPPLPDVAELGGWVYSSTPVAVREEAGAEPGARAAAIDRLRQAAGPAGELVEGLDTVRLDLVTPGQLEREGASAGLRPAGRIEVPETEAYVGSTVVVLEAPR